MGVRGWGLVVAAALVLGATGGQALAAPPRTMLVSGQGGQSAVLTVGRGGATLGYPFFIEPRVPGTLAAVGGVAITRVPDGRLVGGVLLQNAPDFDRALDLPLVGFDQTKLRPGRYRFTLLGTGPRSVHLQVLSGSVPTTVTASGRAIPVTRTLAGSAALADSWSADLGRIGHNDYLVLGGGSGGDRQQADEADLCLQSTASAAGDPCIGGTGLGLAPGAGGSASWSAQLYAPGAIEPGRYLFTGHAVGVGPASVAAHTAVIITVRR